MQVAVFGPRFHFQERRSFREEHSDSGIELNVHTREMMRVVFLLWCWMLEYLSVGVLRSLFNKLLVFY